MLVVPGHRVASLVSVLVLLVVVTQLLLGVMVRPTAARWPVSSSMPMYECCCDEEYECGGCFICRNFVNSCYCESCSCYDERTQQRNNVDLIRQLLRGRR